MKEQLTVTWVNNGTEANTLQQVNGFFFFFFLRVRERNYKFTIEAWSKQVKTLVDKDQVTRTFS